MPSNEMIINIKHYIMIFLLFKLTKILSRCFVNQLNNLK